MAASAPIALKEALQVRLGFRFMQDIVGPFPLSPSETWCITKAKVSRASAKFQKYSVPCNRLLTVALSKVECSWLRICSAASAVQSSQMKETRNQ